jgi:protein-S-isoprenylcysteine O-methyltransferase Ste14
VVFLWVVLPLFTAFLVDAPALLRPIEAISGNPVLVWSAFGLAVVAFGLTWVCWVKMGKSWRMGIDPNERTQLVFNGPFAYVRNPIYGLSSLLMVLTMIVICSPLMIVVGVLHLVFMQWEVRREERALLALHGPAYADYFAKVGRFLPKLTGSRTPPPSDNSAKAAWSHGH